MPGRAGRHREHTSVDNKTLLRLVPKTSSFFRASRARSAVHGRELAVLPGTHTQHETHDIALLVTPELFHVLIGTHDCR